MEVSILKYTGEDTGKTIQLDKSVFNATINNQVLYLSIKNILANKRRGTHSTKERWAIKGSTRKIKKQKGTGTARAGSITSPIFKGGARVFGPKPRSYGFKLNKNIKKISRKSALSYKAQNNNILVLQEFTFDSPKTKSYLEMISNLSLSKFKSLLVTESMNMNIYLSSRNLRSCQVTTADDLNVYDITNANKLIFTESALDKVTQKLI